VSDFVLGSYVPFSKPKTKSDTAHSDTAHSSPRTPRGVHVDLPAQEANGLGQAADGLNIEPFDDGRLGGIGRGNQQAIAPFGNGLDGH